MSNDVTQESIRNKVDTDGNPLIPGTFYTYNGQGYMFSFDDQGFGILIDSVNPEHPPILSGNPSPSTPTPTPSPNPDPNDPAKAFDLPDYPLTVGLGNGFWPSLRMQMWGSALPRDHNATDFPRWDFGPSNKPPSGPPIIPPFPWGPRPGRPDGGGGGGGGGGSGGGGGGGGTGGGGFPPFRGGDPGIIPRSDGIPGQTGRQNFDFSNQPPADPFPQRGSTPAGGLLTPSLPAQRILTTPTDRGDRSGLLQMSQPTEAPQSGLLANKALAATPSYAPSTSIGMPGPVQGNVANAPKAPGQPTVSPDSQGYFNASAQNRQDYAAWLAQGAPLNQYVNNPDAGEHYNLAQILAIRNGVYTPPPAVTPNFGYTMPTGDSTAIYNAWLQAGKPRYDAQGNIVDTRGTAFADGAGNTLY